MNKLWAIGFSWKTFWNLEFLRNLDRSDLKNVFWPNVFVGASSQILEILKYSSSLRRGPAATLNQNPIFEMASNALIKTQNVGQAQKKAPEMLKALVILLILSGETLDSMLIFN